MVSTVLVRSDPTNRNDKLNLISQIRFFMIKLILNFSCHIRIGSIAGESASVLGCYMVDINLMELFGIPAEDFPVNYLLIKFL